MSSRCVPALGLLLALVACDGGGDTSQQQVTRITGPKENPYHQRLLQLNETDRKLALRRAVQDDGGTCRQIKDSAYQQQHEGMAMWIARCSSGDWAVYVAPSGVVQVRACRQAAELGLPECRPSAEQPADQPVWSGDSRPLPPPPQPAR